MATIDKIFISSKSVKEVSERIDDINFFSFNAHAQCIISYRGVAASWVTK